jgi:hypothetical protein
MSQQENVLESRRRQARQMRSQIRSEEYRKKRFRNSVYMWACLFLLIGPPLLFYGAIEYNYIQEPESIPLKMYLGLVWLVVLLTFQRAYTQYLGYQKWDDQLLKLEMETPGLDEQGETKTVTA